MQEQLEYLGEINTTFGEEYKTTQTLLEYVKTLSRVEDWVNVLIFVRKQARFYNISHKKGDEEAKKKALRVIEKCTWVGQTLVPSLFRMVPPRLVNTVLRELERRENEEKNIDKLREQSLKGVKPGDRVAQTELIGGKVTTKKFTKPDPLGEKDLLGELDSDED
jgi:hypothetical protein